MSFKTILITQHCKCSFKNGYLCVRVDDGTTKYFLDDIETVIVDTLQASITSYLLTELTTRKINVYLCDSAHNPVSQVMPLYGAHNSSKKIVDQLNWGLPIKKRVWQAVIINKIYQQARVLEYMDKREAKHLFNMMKETKSGDTTMQEASAARKYFACLFGPEFTRDADTQINACLNYGYAVLLSTVNKEIVSRGYLTQMGINHKNEYNQFNLTCDFMEPFRPVIDRLILDNFNGSLDDPMRFVLCNFTSNRVLYNDGEYKIGSVISLFVQDCIRALNREIDVSDIKGYEML